MKLSTNIIVSVFIILFALMANNFYEWARGPIESEIAVKQVLDDPSAYYQIRILSSNIIAKAIYVSAIVSIIGIWIVYFVRRKSNDETL